MCYYYYRHHYYSLMSNTLALDAAPSLSDHTTRHVTIDNVFIFSPGRSLNTNDSKIIVL